MMNNEHRAVINRSNIQYRGAFIFILTRRRSVIDCQHATNNTVTCSTTELAKGENPSHQFPRNKSVTSWRLPRSNCTTSPQQTTNPQQVCITSWLGQKSVVSVASCRFQNSITTTCCNKSATTSRVQGSYAETCPIDFGLYISASFCQQCHNHRLQQLQHAVTVMAFSCIIVITNVTRELEYAVNS